MRKTKPFKIVMVFVLLFTASAAATSTAFGVDDQRSVAVHRDGTSGALGD
jgi:hypothetical protein